MRAAWGILAGLCLTGAGCEPKDPCDPGQVFVGGSVCAPLPPRDGAPSAPDSAASADGGTDSGNDQ